MELHNINHSNRRPTTQNEQNNPQMRLSSYHGNNNFNVNNANYFNTNQQYNENTTLQEIQRNPGNQIPMIPNTTNLQQQHYIMQNYQNNYPQTQQQHEQTALYVQNNPQYDSLKWVSMPKHGNKFGEENIGTLQDDGLIRRGFAKKVLCIVLLQLLVTLLFVIPSTVSDSYRIFLIDHEYLMFIAVCLNLICLITLYCYRTQCKTVPINYILLFVFTITQGFIISASTATARPYVVFIIICSTIGLVGIITLIALYTNISLNIQLGMLLYLIVTLFIFLFIGIFWNSQLIAFAIGVTVIGIFSFFLIFSIQRVMKDQQTQYSIDDYIIAALDIYINIIVIFQLMMCLSRR